MMITGSKTKIVCTLGPSTESAGKMKDLIEGGMSVARFNMSHGTIDWHEKIISRILNVSESIGRPIGLMVDVPGTKYRTGRMTAESAGIGKGSMLTLTSENIVGDDGRIGISPPGIHLDASVGGRVLVDDGLIELKVLQTNGLDVTCEVVRGGVLTEGRGVITPGKSPSLIFPDDKAKICLKFAAKHNVDFVALSTVTSARDIESARTLLASYGMSNATIISKIERAEAIERVETILEVSDALMVARGDMGVEVPLERVPVIQKDLISKCNSVGKPVITATQMLESMITSSVPTRAEVADVANAVYDGSDAVMLSGETSVGMFPVEAVKVMSRVAVEAEANLQYESIMRAKWWERQKQTDDSISYDACHTANLLNCSLIVAFTESGSTPGRVSKYKPRAHILALTPHRRIQKQMTLQWGVSPVVSRRPTDVEDFFARAEEAAREVGVKPGSRIVLVMGLPIGVQGSTNLLRVMNIQ